MKKILCAWLAIFCLLGLAGCGGGQTAENIDEDRDFVGGGFGYVIPAGWVKLEKYSTDDKVFYCLAGHEEDKTPDNISVEVQSNRYAAEDHMQFRDAIVRQLMTQLQGVPATLTGDGTFTDDETVMYIFTITEDATEEQLAADPEAVGVITRQYYIVGEKKYALVHLTSFYNDEETLAAADRMAKSFTWAQADAE